MKQANKRRFLYFQILFLMIYFADALFYSYTTLYLSSLGLKESTIGQTISVTTICYLLANPIWNLLAVDSKRIRRLTSLISLVAGSIIVLYSKADRLEWILILTGLLAIHMAPFYTFLDSEAIRFCKTTDQEYSRIRVMGSISYILGSALGGLLADRLGYSWLFVVSGSIFIASSVAIYFFLPKNKTKVESQKRNWKAVFNNRLFFFYVACYLLTVTLNGIGDSYVSLLFCNIKGLSAGSYGFVAAGMIATEALTLILLGIWFKKAKELYLLLFAGIVYFLRSFLLGFTDLPVAVLIPSAMLRGVAWGTILFVHMKYLSKLVGLENTTTGALVLAGCTSLFQFIGNSLFGYFFEHLGYLFSYWLIAFLSVFACLGYVLFSIHCGKKENGTQNACS